MTWKKIKLGALLTESKIISEKPNTDKRLTVRLNVQGVEKRPIAKDKKGATTYYVRKKGQFIYGKQNLHKGAFGIIPNELDGFESSSDIPAFDISAECYPEWIYYFFLKGNFYLKLESLAKGVGSKRINPSQIFDLDIYLPSIEEQKIILKKIQLFTEKKKSLEIESKFQLDSVKKLKFKLLDDCIYGELTKNWRKLNSDIKDGNHLVNEIKTRQLNWIKENKNIGYKEAFTIEKKLKKLSKSKLKTPDIKLPPNWVWAPIIEISQIVVDCHNKTAPYINEGVPLIRTSNIRNGELNLITTKYVSEETYNFWSRRCPPLPGDILFTREAPVGEGAIIPEGIKLCMGQRMMLIRVYNDLILREYLLLVITSPDFLNRISKFKKGTLVGHLRIGDVENFHIPVPPYQEQIEIVTKMNILQNLCIKSINLSISNLKNIRSFYDNYLIQNLGELPIITPSATLNVRSQATSINQRTIKFNSNTLLMDLVNLLKENGKLHAEDLWKMSKYPNDIDTFYAELKIQIEEKKSIKESTEKGYLELV